MADMNVVNKRNRFVPEEYFFILDSDRLDEVSSKMYGFSIQNDGIIEDEDLQSGKAFVPSGHGVYVCLQKENDTIRIYQDFNGSYGIYVFRKKGGFVISNSFMRLTDYVKSQHKITLNDDYARHFVVSGLCSIAYTDTMIKEIEMMEKNVVLNIDCKTKEVTKEFIDYKENTVKIDSQEGIEILDRWYARWTGMMRSIQRKTNNMTVALSGGFDSRLTFMLLLKSGIDLNKVQVYSIEDTLHTHKEDFEIATQIAKHFNFKLNNGQLTSEAINYTLEDIIGVSFYTKLSFHKQMYYKYVRYAERRFSFPGSGGECIRIYWGEPKSALVKQMLNYVNPFSGETAAEMKAALERVMDNSFRRIEEKYGITDPNSEEYGLNLYRETRCRNHFGKAMVEDYLGNTFTCAPLLDPDLHTLKLNDDNCIDKNLLMAFIYVRYCRDLLDFKFEGGRAISPETIKYAEKLNEKYPFSEEKLPVFDGDVRIKSYSVSPEEQNERVTEPMIMNYHKKLFLNKKTRHIFDSYLDDQVYRFALDFMKKTKFHPLQNYYMVLGITKVLNDVYANKGLRYSSLQSFMEDYIGSADTCTEEYDPGEQLKKISDYITARFDIKITDNPCGDFEILYMSDPTAKKQKPEWMQKNGTGYIIESDKFSLDMSIKCVTDGKLRFALKGKDVRDAEKNRIPRWIDFSKMQWNDKVVFDEFRPAWHDEPVVYAQEVKSGEVVYIHIEWNIHSPENNGKVLYAAEEKAKKEEAEIKEKLKKLEKKIDSIKKGIEEMQEERKEEKATKKRFFK